MIYSDPQFPMVSLILTIKVIAAKKKFRHSFYNYDRCRPQRSREEHEGVSFYFSLDLMFNF